ncbi:MAG: nucleotidyltransferase, partial [Bacteroidetes bacterium]|nr:nucleotidyltransferase [Bacteroidota bacterium]
TDIIFFDGQGKDLPTSKTKSVERLFFGEDFPRAHFENVGTIKFPERITESYVERLLASINTDVIRTSGLKMVMDYSHGVASTIFPNILGGLNVQIVALNAYLDERKLTRTKEEFDQSMQQLAYVVTSLKYDFGCMFDAGAERIFLVDEHGRIIDSDRLLTLIVKYTALATPELKKIAVPISASGEVDLLADEFGFSVIRTRDSHLALMEAATDKEITFVGGTKGGFIFNDYLFASDAMYNVTKLLEFLALTRKSIGSLDDTTPRLSFVKKNIPCPWHIKGRVMRHLMKDSEHLRRELVDGVKVFMESGSPRTSVLITPDRARPIFHINAESADVATAQQLCEEYAEKVKRWIEE